MIREFVTENLGLKILSLMLAILLEAYFYSPDNSIIATFNATIELQNLRSDYMVVSPPVGERGLTAKFSAKCPKQMVDDLRGTAHRFLVDVPNGEPTSFKVALNPLQLRLPAGVEITEIDPPTISVTLDKVIRKKLLVVVDKIGEPALGYRVDEVVLPETVTAQGPKSELDGFNIVNTEKVDISSIKETRQMNVELVNKGPLTTLLENAVTVELRVTPIPAEKTFSRAAVKVLAPSGYAASVEPSTVEVTLGGPANSLEELKGSSLELVADSSALGAGRHEVGLSIRNLPGVSVVRTKPSKVGVTLVKKEGR